MSRVSWNCTFCNFMFCGNCINWETWCFWSTLAENLEAFAQAPDGLPMVSYKFWSRNKAGEEGGHHFFTSICWSPNLEGGGSTFGKNHTTDCCVVSESLCNIVMNAARAFMVKASDHFLVPLHGCGTQTQRSFLSSICLWKMSATCEEWMVTVASILMWVTGGVSSTNGSTEFTLVTVTARRPLCSSSFWEVGKLRSFS